MIRTNFTLGNEFHFSFSHKANFGNYNGKLFDSFHFEIGYEECNKFPHIVIKTQAFHVLNRYTAKKIGSTA